MDMLYKPKKKTNLKKEAVRLKRKGVSKASIAKRLKRSGKRK